LINNRQGGRRRGRGGQRPQGNPGRPDQGNRIDNRARGNAQQLHEKYKNLARDAQMAGDRVNTEYYLQFADHYFRVLNENRARFEDQRRPRDDAQNDEDFDDGDEFDVQSDAGRANGREHRAAAPRRDSRDEAPAGDTGAPADAADAQPEEPRRTRGRRRRDEPKPEAGEAIEADRLPPAIAREDGNDAEEPAPAEAPRRRRRSRPAEPANEQLDLPPAA